MDSTGALATIGKRDVRGLGSTWPLYRIDTHGQPRDFGSLTALRGSASLVISSLQTDWMRDDFSSGMFPGVPWFLEDQRPQGFIGHGFARRSSGDLGFPWNIGLWGDDDVLAALLQRGDLASSNFVLGDKALCRVMRSRPEIIPRALRGQVYGELATRALVCAGLNGWIAGEQPKFTTTVDDGEGLLRHVIVKFSEPVDDRPSARRWADLLICEHLADKLLAEQEGACAHTNLVWSQGRVCLEVTRFDRVGEHGRRGCVTLAAWSDAHDGDRDDWPDAALRMQQRGWLESDVVEKARKRWWFGQMTANTDMHFGNLGFFLDEALPLRLTPSYDMLPMLYRPASSGELLLRRFQPPVPKADDLAAWNAVAGWAELYWQQVADHPDISDDFRQIAVVNRDLVARMRRDWLRLSR